MQEDTPPVANQRFTVVIKEVSACANHFVDTGVIRKRLITVNGFFSPRVAIPHSTVTDGMYTEATMFRFALRFSAGVILATVLSIVTATQFRGFTFNGRRVLVIFYAQATFVCPFSADVWHFRSYDRSEKSDRDVAWMFDARNPAFEKHWYGAHNPDFAVAIPHWKVCLFAFALNSLVYAPSIYRFRKSREKPKGKSHEGNRNKETEERDRPART